MHSIEISPAPELLDELTRLELLVAKRADELWRLDGGQRPDREVWQQAEAEIWRGGEERANGGRRNATRA